MKLLTALEKNKDFYFLVLASLLFFFLRFPSLYEPYWYGDEGVYDVVAMGINRGRLLYRDIWDNKPPLMYLLYALFSSDQFTIRLVSLISGILSLYLFYLIAKRLFAKRVNVYLSSFLFILFFATPLLEGNIANAENFMILPILAAVFFTLEYIRTKKSLLLYLSGFLLSTAFLFKVVAVFDASAFFIFIFLSTYKNKDYITTQVKKLLPFILSFIFPIIAVVLFFVFKNAFSYFVQAVFTQNVGYVAYANKFIIPQGFLLLKSGALFAFIVFILKKRKIIDNKLLFIFLWAGFSLFNAFFSQRLWTHYLLVLVPSFILLFTSAFTSEVKQVFSKRFAQISVVFITIVVLIQFPLSTKTLRYYGNFLRFLTNKENVYSYRRFFDGNVPTDYEIADWLKTKDPKTQIFLFGNDVQVYKLANKLPPGRFTAEYHMLARTQYIEETQLSLNRVKPKYIIATSEDSIPFNMTHYASMLQINKTVIYERIF